MNPPQSAQGKPGPPAEQIGKPGPMGATDQSGPSSRVGPIRAAVPVAVEREVLAAAFYLARFARDWPARPFWMLRRCVVPYVSTGQFLLLRKDDVPAAFAGWAFEQDDAPMPWRAYGYLPSAVDLAQAREGGRCVVTELISPFLPAQRVLEEVGRYLGLASAPAWLELDAERKIVIHGGDPGNNFPDSDSTRREPTQ
jgi:hemolysin-activating ACP:hemolysin acyltransferase